jgi:hypothetical protein
MLCSCLLAAPRADEIAGKSMTVTAGVTRAALGCDLLISRHDLLRFQADGYTLSAKA